MREERYESLDYPWKRNERNYSNYSGSSGVAWDNQDRYDSRRLDGESRGEPFREPRKRSWDYQGTANEPRGWSGGNHNETPNEFWKRDENHYEPLNDSWGRDKGNRAEFSNIALRWDSRNRYEPPNESWRWGDRSREESLGRPPTGPSREDNKGRNETSDRLWRQGGRGRDEPSEGPWGQGGRNHDEPPSKRLKQIGKSSLEFSNAPGSTHPKPPTNDHGGFNNNRSSRREHLKGKGWGKVAGWSTRLTGSKQSPAQMRFLWGEALEILGGLNPDLIQNVADRLVDRDNIGRLYIEQVVSHDYPSSSDTDYLATAIPFLLFMTHPELTNSLSIDRQVGTLYNYLYGTNGAKAVQFFGNLAKQLNDESDTTNRTSGAWSLTLLGKPSSFSKALASTVECLRHTLRRNQNAGFNEAFKTCAEAFCALANLVPSCDEYYAIIDASLKEVIGIHRQANLIIERPAPLPASQYNQDNHFISSFPIEIDFPGYLSDNGARHDNDHVIFREIQLFPTLDEIKSERKDYLPLKDTSQPHFLQGVDRLLDTHFRLLRHDSVAALKEAVWMVSNLLKLPERQRNAAFQSATRKSIQCFLYIDAQVTTSKFDKMRGLEIGLSFLQPQPVIDKSPREQTKWWEEHKRFERGSLACLVSSGEDINRVIFLTTCKKETKPEAKDGLANGKYGNIYVQLAETQKQNEDIQFLLGQISSSSKPTIQVLLEFPGILPATFIPVLKNLQDLSQSGTLPLSQWIAPTPEGIIMDPTTTTVTATDHTDNPPPAYSRNVEFCWDLKPILTNPSKKLFLSSTSQPEDPQILDSLETMTRLDRGQCKALITGLTKEMSLIQGPPGTGKSYVGVQLVRVLLHNKRRTEIGPIVCVCYTNHALDQFLEHLMQEGIDKIIRIGGQSKSKELEGKSLQTVARVANKTPSEKAAMCTHHENLDSIQEDAEDSCKKLFESLDSWSAVEDILQWELPTLYRQFDISSPEREQVSDPKNIWNRWRYNRDKPAPKKETQYERSMEDIFECEDIWSLSKVERIKLVGHLSQRVIDTLTASLAILAQGHAKEISGLNAQYHEVDRRCLDKADVIGITTTGLAKNVKLLKRLSSKVVICEEAGEVLEGHLINAILPTCQHLIQIGDHEQLRPQINTYDLSLESIRGKPFRLDESMFERLVSEKALSPAQLNIQRRMRPEISNLVRNTLYPELQDHPLTGAYPDVVGMRKNMFWLDHSHPETGADDSQVRSHSNDWEVKMTSGLVRHLVRQGHYDSKDIAVLTPYTGQLQKLRRELGASFEVVLSDRDEKALAQENFMSDMEPTSDMNQFTLKRSNLMDVLRVATVDNFQGEEAKIVVISLVRSNWGRKVGFLKTSNRINVLLSRAKHGMYIIGNSETAGLIPMWRDVCMMLRDANAIGNALDLVCPRHRETPIQIKEPGDFLRLSPEGGCDLPCNKRLDRCGHRCFSKCHSDRMHQVATCAQPCDLLHPTCKHRCQKNCSDKCGMCMMPVHDFPLPCGHFLEQIECWRTQSTEVIRCTKSLIKTALRCGHAVKEECWVDVSSADYKCPTICKSDLTCGHSCTKTCGTCLTVVDGEDCVDHGTCGKFCGRKFTTCNHTCIKFCHDGTPCGLCDRRCQVKCEHSSCSKDCRESCAPCAESCVWKCEHQEQCLMPCSAPCERFPCDERCDRKLPCGHRCPSVCGEICPGIEFCQLCCTEGRKGDLGVDMLEFSPYSSIDLDKNPILVLSCGHFFTRETLDGYLELHKAYSTDDQGNYTGFVDPEGKLDEQIPKCPTCRQPFLQYTVRRYGRVVNRAAIMEMTKRFLASTFNQYKKLADASSEAEKTIYESRDNFLNTMSSLEPQNTQKRKDELLGARLEPLVTIRRKLSKFVTDVDKQRQPANKLYEMTVARKTSFKLPQTQITATLYFRPDTRMELLAKILQTHSALLQVTELSLLAHHLTSVAKATSTGNLTTFANTMLKESRVTINKAVTNCRILIKSAKKQNLPRPEVELLVIFAKLVAIWRQIPREILSFNNALTNAVKEATESLDRAEKLCEREFTGAENLKKTIEAARKQLYNDATFYQDVSQDELQSVVRAMKAELNIWTPTGHWYYCQNGHPFTIDLCGQPMEETLCPECGAPVGGNDHRPVAGMQSAVELEAIANVKSEN